MKIMNTHTSQYAKKTSSITLLLLLALSTLSLIAFAPVHVTKAASGPSISLSQTSGTGGVTTGVEVTGTGFPELQAGSHVVLCFRDTTLTLPLTCQFQETLYGQSIYLPAVGGPENTISWGIGHGGLPAGVVDPDANGAFQAFFDPESLACVQTPCTYSVFVQYTPNNGAQTFTSTVTWTNTPYLEVRLAQDNGASSFSGARLFPTARSGHFGSVAQVYVRGFGALETVNIIGLPTSALISLTTNAVGKSSRTAPSAFIVLNSDTQGGAKTITAIGISTGASATRAFTIKPSIEVFSSNTCTTPIFSISSTAPRTIFLMGHGLSSGETIAANSITLGGTATSSNSLTGATDGSFSTNGGGTSGNKDQCVAVISTGTLSFGPTSIGITGSKSGALTFSGANANIVDEGVDLVAPAVATMDLRNFPLLVSVAQTMATDTAIVSFSANDVWATNGNLLGFWGTNAPGTLVFVYATGFTSAGPMAASTWDGTLLTSLTPGADVVWFSAATDSHGANFGVLAVPESAKGGHTVLVGNGGAVTNPGASVNVVPAIWFNTFDSEDDAAGVVAFSGQNCLPFSTSFGLPNSLGVCGLAVPNYGYIDVYGSGFKAAENVGISMGTTQITASLPSVVPASGSFFFQFPLRTTGFGGVPDIPAGTYDITAAGTSSGNTATGVDTLLAYLDNLNVPGVTVIINPNLGSNLTPPGAGGTVNVGDTVGLQSSIAVNTGIHGLAASSSYEVHLDGPSGPLLTTFTSNANGQVPPAISFKIPQTTSGNHVIDLVQSGASAITAMTINAFDEPAPFGLNPDEFVFGGLYFHVAGALTLTPTAGGVGTNVIISGSGLATSQGYAVQVCSPPPCTVGLSYATFTTDASGGIPASSSFVFPGQPTYGAEVDGELGSQYQVNALNTNTAATDAKGIFLLQAQLTLGSSAGPAGSTVTFTATGLYANTFYNLVWNAQLTSQGLTSGQFVGAFQTKSDGSASGNFVVPSSAATGTYSVSLLQSGEAIGLTGVPFRLAVAPIFTVGGAPTGVGFTISGTPLQVSLSGTPFLSVTYTNGGHVQVTGIVIMSVQNALGQTVYITTSTISPAAGQSATAYLDMGPLASGSYTANVFVISTSGGSLSAPTTGVSIHV